MFRLLRRLCCHHAYVLTRWHWARDPRGDSGAEVEYKCIKCGKRSRDRVAPGSPFEHVLMTDFARYMR